LNGLSDTLRKTAAHLVPHQAALLDAWTDALVRGGAPASEEARRARDEALQTMLSRLSAGEMDALLADEAREAEQAARTGVRFEARALAIRVLDRCCLPFLLKACPDKESLAECLLALDELADRRLELLIRAQEDESARRLLEAQEQAAHAAERARELTRSNEDLRRSEAHGERRAELVNLLATVTRRIVGLLDPEELMQEAADTIRARMNHTFVAVVVLDNEGILVGRWAGREGVGRRSAGRTQGPVGGVIGRALRKRAPQVVADVQNDPDYYADVPGTRSEMAIPLIEFGEVVGAVDFQSEKPQAFGLDEVAVGETVADVLVVALRNARLYAEARRSQ
jgi:putative methionine-R-sulfoxide reductase with GAF domain